MSTKRRGPLPMQGGPPARNQYKCLIPTCNGQFRGDKLKGHYTTTVNFDLLQKSKIKTAEQSKALIAAISDENERTHTQYFFESKWFSKEDIPSYAKHKTKRCNPTMNPFEQCKAAKQMRESDGSNKAQKEADGSGKEKEDTNGKGTENEGEKETVDHAEKVTDDSSGKKTGGSDDNDTADPYGEENADAAEIPSTSQAEIDNLIITEMIDSETPPARKETTESETQHPDVVEPHDPEIDESPSLVDLTSQTKESEKFSSQPSSDGSENVTSIQPDEPKHIEVDTSEVSHTPTLTSVNIKQQVKEALLDLVDTPEIETFSEALSMNIASKVKTLVEEKEKADISTFQYWISTDKFEICEPCLRYSDHVDVPAHLKPKHKGQFGYILKNQAQKNINSSKRFHLNNELHVWCCVRKEKDEKEKVDNEIRSKKAGMMVIRNAVFCLKKGLSSQEFVELNVKDNLTEDLKEKTATKNDSRAEFFGLRTAIHDKLTSKIKNMMKNVKFITVTLDKVTIQRKSFMVIVTYFFHEGSICVLVNKLEKLTLQDYDGPGTADMLLRCLEETLGIPRHELGVKLVHATFDGVFAEKSQRVRGGGSLSLVSNLVDLLNLPPGSITGDWDPSHLMQLIFSDTMKDHPIIMKVMTILFNAMKEFNLGKASTHFEEVASELGHIVLKNKTYQTTRFVRSFVRAITAALRNLPTIHFLIAEEYEEAVKSCNNTQAAKLNIKLKELRSTENLATVIGITQILEIYTEASLACQHLLWFPTQIWEKINEAKDKIHDLSQEWKWHNGDLKIAAIGNPKTHIDSLREGIFKPFVPRFCAKNATPKERETEFGLNETDNLFDEDDRFVQDFAGEIAVEGDFDVLEEKIVHNLKGICESLAQNWQERQNETDLQKETVKTFAASFPEVTFEELKKKLDSLILSLPDHQQSMFDSVIAAVGFEAWNKFHASKDSPINITWKDWIMQLNDQEKIDYCMFIDLFQLVQVRCMSEAICETVGSVMANHIGRGRNLQPENFSQEVCLRMNLGPLHLLNNFCAEILQDRPKDYIRKLDISRRFDKLISKNSASVENFKKAQEEKAKLPFCLWE